MNVFQNILLDLFNRLQRSLSEREKLTILRRNIVPYFIHALGLHEVDTVEDLRNPCKKVKAAKSSGHRNSILEPYLACTSSGPAYMDTR